MKTALVTATSLNLRSKPGMDGAVLAQLPRDAKVQILAQAGVWYQVKTAQGQQGYAHGDFLRIVEAPSLQGFLKDQPALGNLTLPTNTNTSKIWRDYGGLLGPLSDLLEIPPAVAAAIVQVESGGKAFGADGRLVIRFENHIFFREWGRTNARAFATQFAFDENKPWTGHLFRDNARGPWEPLHNGTQANVA